MKNFNLSIPTKIYFGEGILESVFNQENSIFTGNVLIVTGKSAMRRLGYIEKLEQLLKKTKNVKNIFVFEGITPNPRVEDINSAIEYGIQYKINIVIGLGGGSTIDAAKAIAVGIGAKENINKYVFYGKTPPHETLPIIAIPTTAGTGSELSRGAIITSIEKEVKVGIRGDNIYPKVSIIDPTLTYEVPEKATQETGFDVFTHAVETYISKKANLFTEMLSIEALKIAAKYLPTLIQNKENKEARIKMSYASMLMGINLGNASTCLPHRLQYPVGALTDTSHGLGLASIYKAWIFYSYEYSSEKFNTIGTIMTGEECNSREDVMNSIINFMEKINLNISLTDIGVDHKNVKELCDKVIGNIEDDPVSIKKDIIQKIYEKSMED